MADRAREDAQRTNITDATILDYVEELATLTDRKDTAVSAIRNCRKRAKEAGIDLETLDEKLSEKKLDDDRRQEKLRNGTRYETLLKMSTTLDLVELLQAEAEFMEPDAATQERIDKRDAGQAGITAGRAGEDRTGSNPYDAGTLAYAAFDSGWIQGNETREALTEAGLSVPKPRRRKAAEAEAPATVQ